MPEQLRPLVQPNTYYHVFNRGVNRRTIFRENADYQRFLSLLDKYMKPVGHVLSYALLPDHYHLSVLMKPAETIPSDLLKSPKTLGNTFGHLQNAYARYHNTKYQTVSGLFERPYERKQIDTLEYFRNLVIYHHRNPELHGWVNDYRSYAWSSYQELSHPEVTGHVNTRLTLSKFGKTDAFFAAHQEHTPMAMQNFEFE